MEIKLSDEEKELINKVSDKTGRKPEELVANCISAWINRIKIETNRTGAIQGKHHAKQVTQLPVKPVREKTKKSLIDRISDFFKGV